MRLLHYDDFFGLFGGGGMILRFSRLHDWPRALVYTRKYVVDAKENRNQLPKTWWTKKCRYMSTQGGSRGTNIYIEAMKQATQTIDVFAWMAECVIGKDKDTEEATTPLYALITNPSFANACV